MQKNIYIYIMNKNTYSSSSSSSCSRHHLVHRWVSSDPVGGQPNLEQPVRTLASGRERRTEISTPNHSDYYCKWEAMCYERGRK